MGLIATVAILGAAALAFGVSLYQQRRPRALGEVTLLPYGGIQFVALLAIVLALAHLISLASGVPLTGRLLGGP